MPLSELCVLKELNWQGGRSLTLQYTSPGRNAYMEDYTNSDQTFDEVLADLLAEGWVITWRNITKRHEGRGEDSPEYTAMHELWLEREYKQENIDFGE